MGYTKRLFLCFALSASCLGGCSPYTALRGNLIESDAVDGIQIGSTSKYQVIQRLGSPTNTDPFNPNRWYFIGEKTESFSFLSPEVLEKKVLQITFGPDDMVQSIQWGDGGHDFSIKPKSRKTKTLGKDPSLLQQLLGNFGKFSRQQKDK